MTTGEEKVSPLQLTFRKLSVEVIDARDLIPKDGQGTSSPYVVADFDGQRKRTRSVAKTLNPEWNERIDFIVSDPSAMEAEELEIEVYNDRRMGCSAGGGRKSHFLGRVRVCGSQFAKKGEEGLIYFPLEKKSLFSWVRGDIGLKIYYSDDQIGDEKEKKNKEKKNKNKKDESKDRDKIIDHPPLQQHGLFDPNIPLPSIAAMESQLPPPTASVVMVEEASPPSPSSSPVPVPVTVVLPAFERKVLRSPPPEEPHSFTPEIRRMQTLVRPHSRRSINAGEHTPRVISGRFSDPTPAACNLVEAMPYLFIKVVKARNIRSSESPYVKVRAGTHKLRSKPAQNSSDNPNWNQVFSINHGKPEATLEISIWSGSNNSGENGDLFLGGVCFDLSDVPIRDKPDGPLAPQWYRLEGADESSSSDPVTGDIMLSVWIGTQADDAFPESWNTDAPYVSYTRSKVYQSPKLWYLRVSVLEAQDLRIPPPTPGVPIDVRVKVQMGFQSARTKRSTVSGSSTSFSWNEDLLFVVSEPLDEQLVVLIEDRSIKEAALVGHVAIGCGSVDQRLDERMVTSKWFNLESLQPSPEGPVMTAEIYSGRVHLRLCLEGGYHVLDEAAHVCSDYRPTASQLWKQPVGVLELGILGARGLLPMKTKGGAKGSTDAYCVAKYGKKWVRTRTVTDSFDPRWNEQYTWRVYDPCTVLTIGVFDNWRMFADVEDDTRPDYRIGKVRIRVSTLESNRIYTNSYPLLVLLRSGIKKMGEIEVSVRFACPGMLPDTCALYTQTLLPRMHYLRPIGVAQQEALRFAAIKMVALWLARSEPPMGPEVVRYMLDADSHTWSMRRSKANWFRIMAVLAWIIGLARWVDDIRKWKNPVTTGMVHLLYLVLVWYPETVVPTGILYMVLIGTWYYQFRPKSPAGMDPRLSQADVADVDELDEEFDGLPSGKQQEMVRARYDRLRTLGARVQTVMGDFAAQGERVQALVSWRDPRATRLFIGVCTAVAVVLYIVPAKMVAVALGFYMLRHPMFRDPMPPAGLNFFRRLPSLSDRLL
ncbi:C2 calcium/lipid-binding plant phosphoribosyltransferase-likeprotein [Zostera marina]|uniref:C2 calcium/lipid-binding plant phosphoribosyltransferase-likeprotein n=1 Tax=Zostera marina TaxID=29655 RepID=A0A0K9PMI3_ZOSMR|nr:C2 calcium/lipid-binding plant phosphoribosyltransferase-likeprotein [Zostera marina]